MTFNGEHKAIVLLIVKRTTSEGSIQFSNEILHCELIYCHPARGLMRMLLACRWGRGLCKVIKSHFMGSRIDIQWIRYQWISFTINDLIHWRWYVSIDESHSLMMICIDRWLTWLLLWPVDRKGNPRYTWSYRYVKGCFNYSLQGSKDSWSGYWPSSNVESGRRWLVSFFFFSGWSVVYYLISLSSGLLTAREMSIDIRRRIFALLFIWVHTSR